MTQTLRHLSPTITKVDTVGRIKTDTDGTKLREFLKDLGEDG